MIATFRRALGVFALLIFPLAAAAPAAHAAPAPSRYANPVMITAEPGHPVLLARSAAPARYLVRPGDTLTSIAQRQCGHAGAWPSIWHASGFHNPDRIYPGQAAVIDCAAPSAHLMAAALAATQPAVHHSVTVTSHQARGPPAGDRWDGQHHACGDGDGDGFDMPCRFLAGYHAPAPAAPAADPAPAAAPAAPAAAAPAVSGGFEACVIRAESGGNPAAVNPSTGAAGLYGFLPSTWASLGYSGLPQDASASVQHQAFEREFAASGTSAWAPYDGC